MLWLDSLLAEMNDTARSYLSQNGKVAKRLKEVCIKQLAVN